MRREEEVGRLPEGMSLRQRLRVGDVYGGSLDETVLESVDQGVGVDDGASSNIAYKCLAVVLAEDLELLCAEETSCGVTKWQRYYQEIEILLQEVVNVLAGTAREPLGRDDAFRISSARDAIRLVAPGLGRRTLSERVSVHLHPQRLSEPGALPPDTSIAKNTHATACRHLHAELQSGSPELLLLLLSIDVEVMLVRQVRSYNPLGDLRWLTPTSIGELNLGVPKLGIPRPHVEPGRGGLEEARPRHLGRVGLVVDAQHGDALPGLVGEVVGREELEVDDGGLEPADLELGEAFAGLREEGLWRRAGEVDEKDVVFEGHVDGEEVRCM